MLLVADVGNTDVVFGAFDGEKLKHVWRLSSSSERMGYEYADALTGFLKEAELALTAFDSFVIGSVVPGVTTKLEAMSETAFQRPAIVVASGSPLGIVLEVDTPAEVGVDRIMNCIAAWEKHHAAALIVDFGTATTFSYLKPSGAFGGGAIAPGVKTALYSLAAKAPRLAAVKLAAPPRAIGRNTTHAVQSGLLLGYASLVDGLVDRMEEEAGTKLKVIATGGLSSVMAPLCKRITEVDADLTLTGLRLASLRLKR